MARWLQGRRATLLTLIRRKAIAVPLVLSLLVHAALVTALVSWRLELSRGPERVSEAESRMALELEPARAERAPEPVKEPEPLPPASPPAPEPRPQPAPAKEELVIAPQPAAPVVATAPKEPARAAEPAPAPKPVEKPKAVVVVRASEGEVTFAGVESKRAVSVVYAVDASGAMASSLPFVKAELVRSVAKLDATQSFQVVVFHETLGGEESLVFFGEDKGLVPATPEAKQRLAKWISTIEPSGRSNVVEGVSAAVSLKPRLVMLLSRSIRRSGRGAEPGAMVAAALSRLDGLNPVESGLGRRRTVIKALQFVEDDPSGLLQAIAAAHGDGAGSYRVVPVE